MSVVECLAIIGGGLAGSAAAIRAAELGLRVELFEQKQTLGGRAASFRDPKTGQLVDCCRHVAMGCCTNLADFCRRIGAAECFRRDGRLHFFGPDGTRCDFAAADWLPAPLHLLPGLMRLKYLTRGQRWSIARTLLRLAKLDIVDSHEDVGWVEARDPRGSGQRQRIPRGPRTSTHPTDDCNDETIGAWLRRQGQSQQAIDRFWSVVLVSALGETVDRASAVAARKVFVDGFLASRRAYELEVPTEPLGDIFHRRVVDRLRELDVPVRLGNRVGRIDGDATRATGLVLADGTRRGFDFVIGAVPWYRICSLLPQSMRATIPELSQADRIESAPITAVHLWFDRPITHLPHAALVGRLGQWFFNGPLATRTPWNHYCQVVISASRDLIGRDRKDLVAEIRRELDAILPDARGASLLHWRTCTHRRAVFSVRPGIELMRPSQRTAVENLMLAGDWTATGWPATMEGAVRSGYLAVEAVMQSIGQAESLLVGDLPRSWLARRLLK